MHLWTYLVVLFVLVALVSALTRKSQPARPPTPEELASVQQLAREGRHLDAIRAYRQSTGASLKDAKHAVEAMEREKT